VQGSPQFAAEKEEGGAATPFADSLHGVAAAAAAAAAVAAAVVAAAAVDAAVAAAPPAAAHAALPAAAWRRAANALVSKEQTRCQFYMHIVGT